MYPSAEEDISQLAENCLSTANLSAFGKPEVSRINTLQFIAQLRLSISHVATVLGRQTLAGESFSLAQQEETLSKSRTSFHPTHPKNLSLEVFCWKMAVFMKIEVVLDKLSSSSVLRTHCVLQVFPDV